MIRYALAVILLFSMLVPANAARALDKLAVDAIANITDDVATDKNLTLDQEGELYLALTEAARKDRNLESALAFGECANLLKKLNSSNASSDDDYRQIVGMRWNLLQKMGQNYRGDGVLSAVNYRSITAPNGPEKVNDLIWGSSVRQAAYEDLVRAYESARSRGFTPEQAYGKAVAEAPQTSVGALRNHLLAWGKQTLTGYDSTSAGKDIPKVLEAGYASSNPSTRDIGAVAPASGVADFMMDRIDEAWERDLQTVLRPVKRIVEKVVYPDSPAQPRVSRTPETPSFDGLNRTPASSGSGPGMPTWEQMQQPTFLKRQAVPGQELETWWALKRDTNSQMELKCQRIAYGIDVFKIRQPYADRALRCIRSKVEHLKPNTSYEAVFNVWYWCDNTTTAFFADCTRTSEPPPANQRANLPTSSGKTITVRVRVKSDASGIAYIGLFARGRCAAELSEFYYACPVAAKR